MRKTVLLLIALTFAVPRRGWSAQTSPAPKIEGQAPAEIPGFKTAEGALTRVESAQQLLWSKGEDGKEIEFKYSTETQLAGGKDRHPAGVKSGLHSLF